MKRWIRWMRGGAVVLLSIGGIVILLIWLAGGFHEKIEPGPTQVGMQPLGEAQTFTVERVAVPFSEEAVGTVQAEHETEVGAKIMARVLAVHFRAGQLCNLADGEVTQSIASDNDHQTQAKKPYHTPAKQFKNHLARGAPGEFVST